MVSGFITESLATAFPPALPSKSYLHSLTSFPPQEEPAAAVQP
jgi:hypothetical protein